MFHVFKQALRNHFESMLKEYKNLYVVSFDKDYLWDLYLSPELTPHRKVFEALGSKMVTPYNEDQLSGLGFSSTVRNSVICKVLGTFERIIKINF